MDAAALLKLIRAATPGPLKINRYDNPSCINYQVQSEAHGVNEREDHAVVANIRDDECPRAKATAELIVELYNNAEHIATLEHDLAEVRTGYHALDANWEALTNVTMDALRLALDMPEATVPEMCQRISDLRQTLLGAIGASP
jgi:hypothetical protein